MLNYENFKEVFKKELSSYFSDVNNLEIKESEFLKVNEKKDAINVIGDGLSIKDSGNNNLLPNIYLDDMYNSYKQGVDIDELVKSVAEHINKGNKIISEKIDLREEITKTDKVFFQLINTEKNKWLLTKIPHRDYLDMSIIYRTLVNRTSAGVASTIIDNNIMQGMNMTEEGLYEVAYKNTEKLFPTRIDTMEKILMEHMGLSDVSESIFSPETSQMYIITNSKEVNGAAAMIYNEKLDELASKLGTDLYVLPSSIHEVIALSAESGELDELADIVRDVNKNVVSRSEFLSDNVYKYSLKDKKLTQETNIKRDETQEQERNLEKTTTRRI